VLVCTVSFPSEAEARGIVVWGQSEEITLIEEVDGEAADLGYKYSYFSLFWVNIWTWGGEFVAFSGNEYSELPSQDKAEIAEVMGVEVGQISKPWAYCIPPGAAILFVLAVIGIVVKLKQGAE